MDIVERLAQQAAETINGGEFYDGKWYTEGQRQAWRKAMTPAADEIERLREALRFMLDNDRNLQKPLEKLFAEFCNEARKALGETEPEALKEKE